MPLREGQCGLQMEYKFKPKFTLYIESIMVDTKTAWVLGFRVIAKNHMVATFVLEACVKLQTYLLAYCVVTACCGLGKKAPTW
jgi:hypothetical protein